MAKARSCWSKGMMAMQHHMQQLFSILHGACQIMQRYIIAKHNSFRRSTHRYARSSRLPMVLGMLPLMPVLYSPLQSHSTLSHISNQHSFTQHNALLTGT